MCSSPFSCLSEVEVSAQANAQAAEGAVKFRPANSMRSRSACSRLDRSARSSYRTMKKVASLLAFDVLHALFHELAQSAALCIAKVGQEEDFKDRPI